MRPNSERRIARLTVFGISILQFPTTTRYMQRSLGLWSVQNCSTPDDWFDTLRFGACLTSPSDCRENRVGTVVQRKCRLTLAISLFRNARAKARLSVGAVHRP